VAPVIPNAEAIPQAKPASGTRRAPEPGRTSNAEPATAMASAVATGAEGSRRARAASHAPTRSGDVYWRKIATATPAAAMASKYVSCTPTRMAA
jgi:hypothetical protein